MNRRSTLVAGTLGAAVLGLGAAQLLPGAAPTARADGLVGYDSCDELLEHYRAELRAGVSAFGYGMGGGDIAIADSTGAPSASGAGRASDEADAVGPGTTGTNLQEQDVDEPDLAKLRDGRLVVLTGSRLRILSAQAQPQLLGSLRIGDEGSYGGELLLVGDRALVVQPGYRELPLPQGAPEVDGARSMAYLPGTPTASVSLVDVSTDQPRLLETSTYDAQYVSARLVDETVRLVTTTRPQPVVAYPTEPGAAAEQESLAANQLAASRVRLADVLPQVDRRDAHGTLLEQGNAVSCDRTYHARQPRGASTLLVTTLHPADGLAATDRTAVTTDGDLVYASADRLYVATSRWGTVGPVPLSDGVGRSGAEGAPDEVTTELHAFDTTSATSTRYVGSGSVPGYVLGRWALSRHDDALRVATTRQPPWNGDQAGETSSMVVKLVERDGRLVETGRVEGLGKTEQIRAVRYFGNVAAVVTFRQTDPLYLLDLSGDPRVLGELKVPGFSTYLHPLGDGLLLGLGQDADAQGMVTGMQVSVFDIGDLSRPTLVDRLRLGSGWSPALDDSRAFSYDPDRRSAAFPFVGYDPSGVKGEQVGAVRVAVGADGTLAHAGQLELSPGSWASRVLLDDEYLFAISEGGVVAADADTMTRTGSVAFEDAPTIVE
ncbi:MAG: beta-propeller domain-containing protein [Sporichthyaceae bacterium]|nr:beta-propeller domain-containing protein [Sporichthyaceae bacterium]